MSDWSFEVEFWDARASWGELLEEGSLRSSAVCFFERFDDAGEEKAEAAAVSIGASLPFHLPRLAIPQKRNLFGYPPHCNPLLMQRLHIGRPRSHRRDF